MKTKAAAEKAREKCLVEGWVAIEAFTVTGEKRRDAKRKVCWMELTPGLLSLHDQFLGHASSRLPVLGADVRVVEKQEKKPGTVSECVSVPHCVCPCTRRGVSYSLHVFEAFADRTNRL
jgi:hypothetical protein